MVRLLVPVQVQVQIQSRIERTGVTIEYGGAPVATVFVPKISTLS